MLPAQKDDTLRFNATALNSSFRWNFAVDGLFCCEQKYGISCKQIFEVNEKTLSGFAHSFTLDDSNMNVIFFSQLMYYKRGGYTSHGWLCHCEAPSLFSSLENAAHTSLFFAAQRRALRHHRVALHDLNSQMFVICDVIATSSRNDGFFISSTTPWVCRCRQLYFLFYEAHKAFAWIKTRLEGVCSLASFAAQFRSSLRSKGRLAIGKVMIDVCTYWCVCV